MNTPSPVPLYQCNRCRTFVESTVYTRAAGHCGCGGQFVRVAPSGSGQLKAGDWGRIALSRLLGDTSTTPPVGPLQTVRITPPHDSLRDAIAIANLFGALQSRHVFALELCATRDHKSIALRADRQTMPQIVAVIQGLYPQARFEPVESTQDPARERPG